MKKDVRIELLRIMAVVLVIVIHVANVYCLNYPNITDVEYIIATTFNAASRVCVPIFFMISGCFLSKREYDRKVYWKRIVKFTLILIVWSIVYYAINNGGKEANIFKVVVISIFEATKTQRHLWFMYAIIGIYIVLPFIQCICRNMSRETENLFVILFAGINAFSSLIVPFWQDIIGLDIEVLYPIPVIQGTYYLGYFICGHILYERINEERERIEKYKRVLMVVPVVCNVLMVVITYVMTKQLNQHYETMFWYKNTFVMLASFSVFCLILLKQSSFKYEKSVLNISKYSFGVYLIHMIFLNEIKDVVNIIAYSPIIVIPVVTAVVYICSSLLCSCMNKIPYIRGLIH